jgi:hypothetical protein
VLQRHIADTLNRLCTCVNDLVIVMAGPDQQCVLQSGQANSVRQPPSWRSLTCTTVLDIPYRYIRTAVLYL